MTDRAAVFVDGNNCWHALHNLGVPKLSALNYAKVSEKIVGSRDWIATRFYIGQVPNAGRSRLYDEQRVYLNFLMSCDPRVSVHLGRLESHTVESRLAKRLKRYLADLKLRIHIDVFKDLVAMANAMESDEIFQEKAVDVAIAIDMAMMAQRNEYDTAYLMSADGDLTPVVKAVIGMGKKVYVASPQSGAQLASVATKFLPLKRDWFDDCFGY